MRPGYCVPGGTSRSSRLGRRDKAGIRFGKENFEIRYGKTSLGCVELPTNFGRATGDSCLERGDGLVGTREGAGPLHNGIDEPGNCGGRGLHIHIELMLA